jgi:hypothetical protein
MGVDNVVELEVVTADGKFVKASACSNSDLFWALRGGGGGTYGIVVGGTVKVHPTFPVTVTRFFVNSTSNYDPKMFNAVAHFLQRGTDLRNKYGLQGYFYVYPNGFHSVLHLPAEQAQLDNAKKVTAEIMGEMEKIAGAKHIEPTFFQHKSYKEWYVAEMGSEEMEGSGMHFHSEYDGSFGDAPSAEAIMMNPMLAVPYKLKDPTPKKMKRNIAAPQATITVPRTQPMTRTYLDSRLLSNSSVNKVSTEVLGKTLLDVFPRLVSNHVRGFLFGGGAMAKAGKDDMGLNPVWRDISYHYIINAIPGSSRNDYNIRKLDALFPEAGAYVNEAAPGEPNWKVKYWGTHYNKLESIKKKYDPSHLFWCSPCVGADYYTYDDERICKNPKYPQSGPAPQTYANPKSQTGIASLPGQAGIPNPLMPIIVDYQKTGKIPQKMPASGFFKIAMGQGGSAGGRWSLGDPTVAKAGAAAPAPMPAAGEHAGHNM